MSNRPTTCWAGMVAALFAVHAAAEQELLGTISFPNSGAPEAQADFIEGVLYLHNFEYQEAAEAFQRAQAEDPDFAMAYWGEAMTYNHPLWSSQSRKEAEDALRRLARTPEARQAQAPTQREKDYLHAVEILYGTVDETETLTKHERDLRYRDAMRRLHERYPDDHEAQTFYGLSILGTANEGRDFATYMQAAAVLTGVWDADRNHPGAAHYLIHSYDDPIHAPLGLPMARAYSKIAPAAAHAQHMTSHIFVALGMWDDLVEANEIAVEVENEGLAKRGERLLVSGHYPYWLEYGYLQQGRIDAARAMLKAAYERVQNAPKRDERVHFAFMRARYVIDAGDWDGATRWAAEYEPGTRGARDYHFASAYAAIMEGDVADAKEALDAMRQSKGREDRPGAEETLAVLEREIVALLALADGKEEEAVALLREAAAMEAEMAYSFGPPAVAKPAAELLGEVLLKTGDAEGAVEALEAQLGRTPLRTNTLLDLARAAEAAGADMKAADARRQLAAIWHDADRDAPGYDDVFAGTD